MFCTNVLMTVCTINLLQQDLFLLTIIILKALCNRRNGAKHIYIELIFFKMTNVSRYRRVKRENPTCQWKQHPHSIFHSLIPKQPLWPCERGQILVQRGSTNNSVKTGELRFWSDKEQRASASNGKTTANQWSTFSPSSTCAPKRAGSCQMAIT